MSTQLMIKANLAMLAKLQEALNESFRDSSISTEEVTKLVGLVKDEIDALMLNRLTANHPEVSLLAIDDVNGIVANLMSQDVIMNKTTVDLIAMISSMVRFTIEAQLINLLAINPEPYTAFWQFAEKLTKVVVDAGDMPEQVVRYPAFWKELYTYESWSCQTVALSALLVDISPADVLGKTELCLTPAGMTQLHKRIGDTFPPGTNGYDRVKKFTEVRDQQSREIFRHGNA